MNITISRHDAKLLIEWARAAHPHECCGLLWGEKNHVEIVQWTQNVATDPARFFEIDPAALIAANRLARGGGLAIMGYFHSHPNGVSEPSSEDARKATADGLIWIIVAGEELKAWQAVAAGALHGRFNPVAISWIDTVGT